MAVILIHGGASNQEVSPENEAKQKATQATCDTLNLKNATALDMVELAVVRLELNESLNAGSGSVVQMDGHIRMDAAICDSQGRYGAVIQIEETTTPIRVARRILDIGYHSILSGDGARRFANEQGFPCSSAFTVKAFGEFQTMRLQYPELTYAAISANIDDINVKKLSTVGAVALDDRGVLAAACSTGGTKFCYPGRVGDTPIFGAGLYCSQHVAVACTGEGDKILRHLTARRVEDGFLQHGDLQRAANEAISDLLKNQNGYAGLIAVSQKGETALAHSTSFMANAVCLSS